MGWEIVTEMRPLTEFFHPEIIYDNGEPRWNDIDKENLKNFGKILFKWHFVHHKSHMNDPGTNTGLRRDRLVKNSVRNGTASATNYINLTN
jgi:hypothetical protein